ncbi:MAG: hypothetical protein M8861_04545, partial [marine benthic group bacterium]|nr:hypothetical protein [Gemmatimonadota bacterium]
ARSDPPRIEQLVVTREFARRCAGLSPFARKHCDRALRRLLAGADWPMVRIQPLVSPAGYHELRFAHRDRIVLRIDGAFAVLVDVASFAEVARLNARTAHRLHGRVRLTD